MKNFLTNNLIRTIYYACVYSRIQYGLEVYGMCSKTNLKSLQVIQNKLLRVLAKKDRYYNSNQLHKDFDLLNIEEARNMLILKFVYNCVNGQPVEVFQDYFTLQTHLHFTRQSGHLRRSRINTEYGRSTIQYTGASLWNKLPETLRNTNNLNSYKQKLKTFLLETPNFSNAMYPT